MDIMIRKGEYVNLPMLLSLRVDQAGAARLLAMFRDDNWLILLK
jgi:hypothetical protein